VVATSTLIAPHGYCIAIVIDGYIRANRGSSRLDDHRRSPALVGAASAPYAASAAVPSRATGSNCACHAANAAGTCHAPNAAGTAATACAGINAKV